MDVPGIDVLRARSAVLSGSFPAGAGDDGLTALATEASAIVSMLTGRAIGVTGEGPFGCQLEEVPPALQPLAVRAIRMRAEQMDLLETNAVLLRARAEQRVSGLASFSAGAYSESYFPPGQTVELLRALDPDPELAAELWALSTECVREGWMRVWHPELIGALEPASAYQEMGWSGEYGYPFGFGDNRRWFSDPHFDPGL